MTHEDRGVTVNQLGKLAVSLYSQPANITWVNGIGVGEKTRQISNQLHNCSLHNVYTVQSSSPVEKNAL